MSKTCIFLLALTFVVGSDPPRASAGYTNYAYGTDRVSRDLGPNNGDGPITANNKNDAGGIANGTASTSVVGRIASFPLSIVRGVLERVREAIGSVISAVVIQVWEIIKNFVIPALDGILMEVAGAYVVPQSLTDLIDQAHTVYQYAKMFGYLTPT